MARSFPIWGRCIPALSQGHSGARAGHGRAGAGADKADRPLAGGFRDATAGGTMGARGGGHQRLYAAAIAWQARRVIPFTGYMAATEELPADSSPRSSWPPTVIDPISISTFHRARHPRILRRRHGEALGAPTRCPAARDLASCPISRESASAMSGRANAPDFDMPHMARPTGSGMPWVIISPESHGLLSRRSWRRRSGPGGRQDRLRHRTFPTRPFYRGNLSVPLAMRWFRRQDRKLAKGA